MLNYADAEALLASLYGAQSAQKTTFRATLKHFKKLGIPLDSSPGRGKKILYGHDELYQWCFCLELSEFGIDPSVIAGLVHQCWREWLSAGFRAAANSAESIYLLLGPMVRSAAWRESLTQAPTIGTPFGFQNREDLNGRIAELSAGKHGRLALFDASLRTKQIEAAIAELNSDGGRH